MRHIVARPRPAALAPFVKAFHYHESEFAPAVERILPNGQAHLMVNLAEDEFRVYSGGRCESVHRMRGAVLAGPHGTATAIDTMEQRHLIAVEFKLAGAAAFFRMPLSEVCNQIVNLVDVWEPDGALVRERLCEAPTPSEKLRARNGVARTLRPAVGTEHGCGRCTASAGRVSPGHSRTIGLPAKDIGAPRERSGRLDSQAAFTRTPPATSGRFGQVSCGGGLVAGCGGARLHRSSTLYS